VIEYLSSGGQSFRRTSRIAVFPSPSDPVTLFERLRIVIPPLLAGLMRWDYWAVITSRFTVSSASGRPRRGRPGRSRDSPTQIAVPKPTVHARRTSQSDKDPAENVMTSTWLRNICRALPKRSILSPSIFGVETLSRSSIWCSEVGGDSDGRSVWALFRANLSGR